MNAFVGNFRKILFQDFNNAFYVNLLAQSSSVIICLIFGLMLFEIHIAENAIDWSKIGLFLIPFAWMYFSKELKIYASVAFLFVVATSLSNIFSPYSTDYYAGQTILLWTLILPFAALVHFSNPSLNKLFVFLTLMLLVGLYPAIHDIYTGLRRYDGFYGLPIVWGNIALLAGLMCLFIGLWSSSTLLKCHGLFCFLLGLFISGVSQSRGGWLAIITLSPLILMTLKKALPSRYFVSVFSIILVSGIIIISNPRIGIGERFADIGTNIHRYMTNAHQGNDTSEGARFEIWRSSIRAIIDRPLFGVGNKGYPTFVDQDSQYNSNVPALHPHNDVLALLACYGIVGFCLMALALYNFYLGVIRSSTDDNKRFFLLAVVLIISFFDFGLTNVTLTGRIGSGFFIFISTYLLVLAYKNKPNSTPAL